MKEKWVMYGCDKNCLTIVSQSWVKIDLKALENKIVIKTWTKDENIQMFNVDHFILECYNEHGTWLKELLIKDVVSVEASLDLGETMDLAEVIEDHVVTEWTIKYKHLNLMMDDICSQ